MLRYTHKLRLAAHLYNKNDAKNRSILILEEIERTLHCSTLNVFNLKRRISSSSLYSSSSTSSSASSMESEYEATEMDKEDIAKRRAKALHKWLENEVGEERASLMNILGIHKVKVPGGQEEAKKMMDDLLMWKAKSVLLEKEKNSKKKDNDDEIDFDVPFE